MLILTRKLNQEIRIGEDIVVKVVGFKGNQIRLGIVAPRDVAVLREEKLTKIPAETVRKNSAPRTVVSAWC